MNDDLLIAIGADISSYTSAVNQAKKEYDKLAAYISKPASNQMKAFGINSKQFATDLNAIEALVDKTANTIKGKMAHALSITTDTSKQTAEQKAMLDRYYDNYVKTNSQIEQSNISTQEKLKADTMATQNSLTNQKIKEYDEAYNAAVAINNKLNAQEKAQQKRIQSIAIKSKHETYRRIIAIKQLTDRKEIASEIIKMYGMKHKTLRIYEETEKKKTAFYKKEAAKRNIDSAVGRGILDSIQVVAKYGAISQALYGIQNSLRAVGAEALRFNQSIADIGAILQLQAGDARFLAGRVADLAVKYGSAVEDIQTATTTLGRAGVSDVDDLAIAMEGLVALSIITGDSMGDGANAMASMISVFSGDTQMLVDDMAAIANATRLGLQDFTTISNYALVAAKSLGLTSQAYLALAGSMSKIGLNASTIGTSIRRLTKITTSSATDIVNFFTQIGTSQRAFADALRKDSMRGLTDFSKLMLNLSDTDFQKILPNEVQTRATLTAIREIGKVKGIQAMNAEMKKFGGVIKQAGQSAVGAQKIVKSLTNAISEMFNDEFTDLFTGLFGDNLQEVQNTVHNIAGVFKFLLTSVVNLGIAFTAVFVGGKILAGIKALKAMTWSLKLTFDSASVSAKKFGKSNLVMVGIAVALEAIFYWSTKAANAQDQLTKNLNITTKAFKAMLDTKQQVTILETRESVQVLRDQVTEAENLLKIAKDQAWRPKLAQFYSEKQVADAKDLVKQNKIKIKQLKEQLAKYANIVLGITSMAEKTAESTEATRVLDERLKKAKATAVKLADIAANIALKLKEASLAFDVLTGKLTGTEAKSIILTGGLEKDNKLLGEQAELYNMLVASRKHLLTVGNNADLEENFFAIDAEIVKAKTAADKTRTAIQLKENTLLKLGNDENKRGLGLITETNKAIIARTYLEAEFSTKKEFSILQAKKTLDLAKESQDAAYRAYDAESDIQKKESLRVGILNAQNSVLAANQGLLKAQLETASESTKEAKEHNRNIRDDISLKLKQAQASKLEAVMADKALGTQASAALLRKREITLQTIKTNLAYKAWQYAKEQAKLVVGGAAKDKAKIKAVQAYIDFLKEGNKLIDETEEKTKDFSGVFENIFTGDIEGAFAGIMQNIAGDLDVTIQGVGTAWSGLMNSMVAGTKITSAMITEVLATTGWYLLIQAGITVLQSLKSSVSASELKVAEGITDVQSESIVNSLSHIEDYDALGLDYSKDMMYSLRSLVAYSDTAAANIGTSLSGDDYISSTDTNLFGLFGATTRELVSSGIKLQSASIQELIDGQLEGSKYLIEKVTDSGFLGTGLFGGESLKTTDLGPLERAVLEPIEQAYLDGIDAVRTATEAFNLSATDFEAIMATWETSLAQLNFEGKSAEEISEMINGVISQDLDSWVTTIAGVAPYIEEFARAGEGAAETLARLVSDFEALNATFAMMGTELDGITDGGLRMAEAMADAAGGMDALIDKLSFFYENFYTDAEQIAFKTQILQAEFARLGITMPTTTLGFRKLVEANIVTIKTLTAEIETKKTAAEATYKLAQANYDLGVITEGVWAKAQETYNEFVIWLDGKTDELNAILESNDALLDLGSTFVDVYGSAQDAADALDTVYASLTDIASLQAEWTENGVEAAQLVLDATVAETGITGVTYDNFLELFNNALNANNTMEQDNLDAWSLLSGALKGLEDAINEQLQVQLDALNSELDFYDEILNTIQDAYAGSLSYLTSLEKAAYLEQQAGNYLADGDISSYLDTLAEQLEYEKATSITKEDYIPIFEKYINDLQDVEYEPEATTDDVVTQIEITNKKLDELAEAIEKASYQS